MELWLDLELRADIDDYITLLYAIVTNKNITELSIVNPSINELKLFKYVKEKYNLNIPIIYSGKIIDLLGNKGIDHNLLDLIQYIELDFDNDIIHINDYLKQNINFENKIVFCGGAFTNLKMILEQNPLQNIIGYLQGGYAGETIVGKENVLEKFKGREQVPSWNPNLDLESTNCVLNSNNFKGYFISKNVCHNSWMNEKDFENENSELYQTLKEYFKYNKYESKCMHDLVAFASIFDKSFIEFKRVNLNHTNDKLVSWYSILNENSNIQISTKLNMNKFKYFINSELNQSLELNFK